MRRQARPIAPLLPAAAPVARRARGRGPHPDAALSALLALCGALLALPAPAADDARAGFRHRAPINIEQPGAFVRLPLGANAYAASRQPGLGDLRVVDARGERVAFALLAPRAPQLRTEELARPVELFPLPPLRAGDKEPANPLELQIAGDRITVRRLERRGGVPRAAAAAPPGWLFDLGERRSGEVAPSALRLSWSGPAEFTAGYHLDVSDDLKQWRRAGGGQLLALQSSTGRLAQREVALPPHTGSGVRFVRLRWLEPSGAPALVAAQQLRIVQTQATVDSPTVIAVPPGPEPAAAAPARPSAGAVPAPSAGALHFDLGAVLPVTELDLPLPPGQRVAPVLVQGRMRADEPWRDLARTVFYRIERGETVDRPPPLALAAGAQVPLRYLRLVPDARAGALAAPSLTVQVQLASIVFVPQGTPPFALLAGSADAAPGALPIATLVPDLEAERARLGRAALGEWSEDEAVARREAWQQRLVAWRPALLWAVLLAGVAGLAGAVWRLARPAIGSRGDVATGAAAGPRPPPPAPRDPA